MTEVHGACIEFVMILSAEENADQPFWHLLVMREVAVHPAMHMALRRL